MKYIAIVLAIMLAFVGFAGAVAFDKPHTPKNLTLPEVTHIGPDAKGLEDSVVSNSIAKSPTVNGLWQSGPNALAHDIIPNDIDMHESTVGNVADDLVYIGQQYGFDYAGYWPGNSIATVEHTAMQNGGWVGRTYMLGNNVDTWGQLRTLDQQYVNGEYVYNGVLYHGQRPAGLLAGDFIGQSEEPASNPGLPSEGDGMYTTGDLTDQ